MDTVSTFVIRIVPASLINIPSPLATAVVPLAVPPSIKLISAAVVVTPSSMLSSAVVAVTPSNKFISVAVEVTATSSFILGDVKVLFVKVAVEAVDTNLASPPVLGSVKTLSALSECGAAFTCCP